MHASTLLITMEGAQAQAQARVAANGPDLCGHVVAVRVAKAGMHSRGAHWHDGDPKKVCCNFSWFSS